MKHFLIAILVLLTCRGHVHAQEAKWEYYVTSIRAILADVKEPEIKEWLRTNRPKTYAQFFTEKTAEPKKEEPKKGDLIGGVISAFAEVAEVTNDANTTALDFYVNKLAKDGWEPSTVTENVIIFRRPAPVKK
jgi:hypothetical protein